MESVIRGRVESFYDVSDFQHGSRQPCCIWFMVMIAHSRSLIDGRCFIIKFRLDLIYVSELLQFLYFSIWLENAFYTQFWQFGAYFFQMTSSIFLAPKTLPCAKVLYVMYSTFAQGSVCRLSPKRENRFNGSTMAPAREKSTGQDSEKV